MGNLLTDKYAEGIPGHRFYAGCDNVDSIEDLADKRACALFGADHAYAQPHSGADANLVAFWAILSAAGRVPALERLGAEARGRPGGRGLGQAATASSAISAARPGPRAGRPPDPRLPPNISGKMFESHLQVDPETFLLDYDAIGRQALEEPADPAGRLQLLSATSTSPDARDRRQGRGGVDGRHGPLRRSRGGQGAHGRLRPDRVRPRRDDDDPQDPARAARRARLATGIRRRRRPRLPAGAGRPAAPRHGRQGRRVHRGVAARVRRSTRKIVDNARALAEAFVRRGCPSSPAGPTTT